MGCPIDRSNARRRILYWSQQAQRWNCSSADESQQSRIEVIDKTVLAGE